jgi:hypothetical protein
MNQFAKILELQDEITEIKTNLIKGLAKLLKIPILEINVYKNTYENHELTLVKLTTPLNEGIINPRHLGNLAGQYNLEYTHGYDSLDETHWIFELKNGD